MKCRDCDVEMVEGSVMIPVYGSVSHDVVEPGDTIYPFTSALGTGEKCPKCGHTVGGRLLWRDARKETLEEMGK